MEKKFAIWSMTLVVVLQDGGRLQPKIILMFSRLHELQAIGV